MKLKDKPVFPVIKDPEETWAEGFLPNGMSLREYYAGLALTRLADPSMPEEIARMCVTIADALIAELEKTGGEGE